MKNKKINTKHGLLNSEILINKTDCYQSWMSLDHFDFLEGSVKLFEGKYRSLLSVCTLPSLLIISIPLHTLPNMVCFPGQHSKTMIINVGTRLKLHNMPRKIFRFYWGSTIIRIKQQNVIQMSTKISLPNLKHMPSLLSIRGKKRWPGVELSPTI